MRPHFLSLDRQGYEELAIKLGLPRFRGQQVAHWVYAKQIHDPAAMKNLPPALRENLLTEVDWSLPEITDRLESEDGTTKLLLKTSKGFLMETVLMRYENRTSLCVSSQVGCKLACRFCQTGKMGFIKHLGCEEILAQLFLANLFLASESRKISHIVFMGMGEPLDNYDAVIKAANLMMAKDGFALSYRHVTISTSGLAPQIKKLAVDSKASLALSLHASRDDLRTDLMPINRKYPLKELKEALLEYQEVTGRKLTFEYILIKDKNCGLREAKELVKFLHGLKAKVNLIPFNAHPGLEFARPDDQEIRAFQKYLGDRSIPAPVRYSKGLEVSAACGQLAAKVQSTLHLAPQRKALLAQKSQPTLP